MTRATHPRLERALRTGVGWGCVLGLAFGLLPHPARADARRSSARTNARGKSEPWVSLKLSDLGVPLIPQAFVTAGSSMLTLDLIDDAHLLVTFSTRDLVPRIPGDPVDDEDRMVAAEVVSLPKGEIMARTRWHMHDHGRYLWRMGQGRYLVRTRNQLFMITPRALLNSPDPLRPTAFPTRPAVPVAALVAPDASLVTVESFSHPPKKEDAALSRADRSQSSRPDVLLDFYRVQGGVPGNPAVTVVRAGAVKAHALVALPMDGDGYLWPTDAKRGKWQVSFNQFDGKAVPVGSVVSSCPPGLQLVSRSEYVAFACQGSEERLKMEAFGMDGHETWEEPLGSAAMPAFAFAPNAGRFAISRLDTLVPDPAALSVLPDGSTQEMRVYQTESGDLLLRAPMSPVMKTAENFDLSEDGMMAAVVNAGAVQVYKLRPLSEADKKDLELAASFQPPLGAGPVDLEKLARDQPEPNPESHPEAYPALAADASATSPAASTNPAASLNPASSINPPAATPPQPDSAARPDVPAKPALDAGASGKPTDMASSEPNPMAAGPTEAGPANGDADTTVPRKPPTLLQPGEKAEYHPH